MINMGTGIYKIKNGVKVELKSSEVKAYIMKVNKLTTAEYNKKYDILRNKLRSYEAYQKAHGKATNKTSVSQLLYKQAKAKARLGSNYRPSAQMRRIESFTSVSSGKAGQKALLGKKYNARRSTSYSETTFNAFENFIEKNATAKKIWLEIEDPVKREQALKDYAEKMHAVISESGKVSENEAIPTGEAVGSDSEIDFDLNSYK